MRGEVPEEISKELNHLPDVVRRLLHSRGIKNKEEAEFFLNPDFEKGLLDPLEMKDMEKGVERILKAIKENEKIIIFGDYDADGVCSSVVFQDFFKKIGFNNFHVHIPDRYLEGYGLNRFAVEEFIKQKAGLIITLDCGVTNNKEVEVANKAGVDVVIIDHHLAPEELPKAYAVIDAKQLDDKSPFKFLCGAGTAFKTICALVKKGGFNVTAGWEKWLLDVVAIATVADMVPLLGENRILVYYGLKVLKKTQRVGLKSFYQKFGLNCAEINSDDLGFVIAPKINVAGRMDHATISFNLLTTESPQEASWINGRLETMNDERKDMVEKILKEIDGELASKKGFEIIACGMADWHPGVLSIAANRLLDKYNVPVFLWGKSGGDFKGSCRSRGSLNLVDFMKTIPAGIVGDFGGHALAGGFTVEEKNIEKFQQAVVDGYNNFPKTKSENDILKIDGKLGLDEVDWSLFGVLEKLQPFGVDNPKPIFAFDGLEIARVKKFGNGGAHLQLDFNKTRGGIISAIGFFMANNGGDGFAFRAGQKINLAASIDKNSFRGKNELRLRIMDAQPVK